MTLIICSNIDCMYAYVRNDGYYQCRCHVIGITEKGKCDSYMVFPKDISKKLLKPKTYKKEQILKSHLVEYVDRENISDLLEKEINPIKEEPNENY